MNITHCKRCNRTLIAEESTSHDCKPLNNYRIEKNILWVDDGEKWYPLKLLPPKNKDPFKTPDGSTEPKFISLRTYFMLGCKEAL